MTRVVSIVNMKGGVAKTTTTIMLAEFLAGELGKRVLLLDVDPQISLTIALVGEEKWMQAHQAGRTMSTLFAEEIDDPAERIWDASKSILRNASNVRAVTEVDLLPSSPNVLRMQGQLTAMAMASRGSRDPDTILADGIEPVLGDYDYVLIDCPPSMDGLTMNALRMSEAYLIPTVPDVLSTYGIPMIQEYVKEFAEDAEFDAPHELGLVLTKFQRNSKVHWTTIQKLNSNPSLPELLEPWVPQSNDIAAAAEFKEYSTLTVKYGQTHVRTLSELATTFHDKVEALPDRVTAND